MRLNGYRAVGLVSGEALDLIEQDFFAAPSEPRRQHALFRPFLLDPQRTRACSRMGSRPTSSGGGEPAPGENGFLRHNRWHQRALSWSSSWCGRLDGPSGPKAPACSARPSPRSSGPGDPHEEPAAKGQQVDRLAVDGLVDRLGRSASFAAGAQPDLTNDRLIYLCWARGRFQTSKTYRTSSAWLPSSRSTIA